MHYLYISLAFAGGLVTGAFIALVAIIYILIDEDNGSNKEAVTDTAPYAGPITMFEPKLRVSWPWATVLLCAMLMASLGLYLIRSAS